MIKLPNIFYPLNNIEVTIKRNNIYIDDTENCVRYDIYYPNGIKKLRKAIIFVHGGANIKQDMKSSDWLTSWASAMAENGIIAITFNWRKQNKSSDILKLFEFVKNNALILGIDINNISVLAFSRGVQMGVTYALETSFIKKIICYYGKMPLSKHTSEIKDKKFLIIMAQKDKYYLPECNDDFITLVRKNNSYKKYVHSTGEHGFDFLNPNEETKELIECTIQFVKEDISHV